MTIDKEFMQYCDKFGKEYKDEEEYQSRKANFKKNLDSIKGLYDKSSKDFENLGDLKLGVNEFSDFSEKEWK